MRMLLVKAITLYAGVTGALLAGPMPDEAKGQSYITELRFSSDRSGPSVVQADSDGSIWVALARAGKIARIQCNGAMREFNLPAGSFPVGLVRDRAGSLYVSDIRRNVIVQLDTTTGATRDYAIPTGNAWPFFLGMSSDGRVWFSERVGNKIGVLDPVSAAVKEYPVPTEQAQPAGLTVTPDDHVYFTENTGHKVGHIDPKIGRVVEIPVPSALKNSPYYGLAGITNDSSGNVWFAELDGRLCRIDRHRPGGRENVVEIPVPNPSVRPAGVAVDKWGIVWFTELDGNAIGSYNPSLRAFDEFPLPTGAADPSPMGPPEATARGEMPTIGFRARTSRPFGIALDSRGRVWFSEQYAHQVGRLDVPVLRLFGPKGRVTSASAPVVLQVRCSASSPSLQFELNGALVPAGKTIDLKSSPGGANELRVWVKQDGCVADASVSFTFDPALETIRKAVMHQSASHAMPAPLAATALGIVRDAIDAERAGEAERARKIEQALIRILAANASQSRGVAVILSQLQWKDRFGRHDHVITVAKNASPPAPVPFTVEAGDSVEWKRAATGVAAKDPAIEPCSEASEAVAYSRYGQARLVFHKPGRFAYSWNHGSGCDGEVVVIPRSVYIEEFPLPDKDSVPGVLAIDHDGSVWFTEGGGGYSKLAAVPLNNKIGRLLPDGTIQQYRTPANESAPTSIHVGAEGHIWFTERAGNNIGELFPDTGKVAEYLIPTPNSGATGITVDRNGTIWFASKASSKIGHLDPATKQIAEMDTPTPRSQPSTITVDDSNHIWFDERAQDKIVRYDAHSGKMIEFVVPTKGSRVVGLVPDHKGNVFFLELGASKVGYLDVASGQVREYSIPTPFSAPFKEALDSQGRLWFTEVFGNKVGMLDEGVFTEYLIPTPESMPGGITIDAQGNIWFSEQAGNKIARIPALLEIARVAGHESTSRSTSGKSLRQRDGL